MYENYPVILLGDKVNYAARIMVNFETSSLFKNDQSYIKREKKKFRTKDMDDWFSPYRYNEGAVHLATTIKRRVTLQPVERS